MRQLVQNYGARKIERCNKSFKLCVGINFFLAIIVGLIFVPGADFFMGLIVADAESIKFGATMTRIVALSVFIYSVQDASSRGLFGFGDSVFSMIMTVFGVSGIRILWINFVFPLSRNITTIYLSLPISWSVTGAVLFIRYLYIRNKIAKRIMEVNKN